MKSVVAAFVGTVILLWAAAWWVSQDSPVRNEAPTASVAPAAQTPTSRAIAETSPVGAGSRQALVGSNAAFLPEPSNEPPNVFPEQLAAKPRSASDPAPEPAPPPIKSNGVIDLYATDPGTKVFTDTLREGYEQRLRDLQNVRTGKN